MNTDSTSPSPMLGTLAKLAGGQGKASRMLGISRQTFCRHLLGEKVGSHPPKLILLAASALLARLADEAKRAIEAGITIDRDQP